ncbi:SPARC-related modular calcium-binding protein 2 isoform X4 [Drosophila kikkawai]|uniref:SPARC-related modular calcium-binding protein 2 isoform X4 n=1 Tax=Drosophila kikkawai TaxID=30033 RepID=A0ABM4GDW4_DROKI
MLARCVFFVTWLAVLIATGRSDDDQAMKLPACAAKQGECDDNEGPVCGTDGQTYPTRCHLLRAQCGGHQVSLKYHESCNACLEAVKYARRQQARDPDYFVPRCRKDGNYAAMQCYGKTGPCWCSDSQGRPIEDTSTPTRRGKPRCRAYRRNRRRLASHQMGYSPDTSASSKGSSESGAAGHRPCSKTDRAMFNGNLMRMLRNEAQNFLRQSSLSDAAILEWKFAKLDTNGNQLLDRQEVKELKKVLKRNVKPRRCGRTFGKYCDVTKDENLNALEWSICFTNKLNNLLNSKPETTSQDTESESNCWMDQSVALEEQGHGGKLFVPQCLPDGRYQRVQCYTSTSYCWCVNEDTGKSIPGTSVKNKRPQCEEDVVVRPMKGCTEPRKTQFLRELKAFLNTSLLPSSTTVANSTLWKSEDERIATLSFVYLDKNKNKSWERREWKVFRDLVTSASNLRRCGKKMPRYCDINGDKKISLAEWLNCLQASPRESATTVKPAAQSNETASPKRQGFNPLERYLKD